MDPQQADCDTTNPGVSRRRFLGGCGALLAAGLSGGTGRAVAQTSGVSPNVARLVFAFPGTPAVGSLLGARGAGIRLDALPTGGLAVAPDPVTITFGDAMAPEFYEWFIGATRTTVNSPGRDVLIIAVDHNNQEIYRLTLRKARVAQVVWPHLGAGAAEVLRFGATLVPESAAFTYGGSVLIQQAPKTKALDARNFRLGIQGLEQEAAQVSSIETFTQRLIPLPGASSAVASIDALRLILPLPALAGFSKWQAEMLAGKAAERTGVLQFMSLDFKAVGQAFLSGLSVRTVDVAPTSAGQDERVYGAGSMVMSLNARAIELDKASFR